MSLGRWGSPNFSYLSLALGHAHLGFQLLHSSQKIFDMDFFNGDSVYEDAVELDCGQSSPFMADDCSSSLMVRPVYLLLEQTAISGSTVPRNTPT